MKKTLLTNFILIITLLTSCENKRAYEKTDHGIIVTLHNQETKTVKLDVIDDHTIHVVASPSDTFSTRKSLIIVPDRQPSGSWTVEEGDNTVTLKTSLIKASISLDGGRITFSDSAGNILLAESVHGKSFTSNKKEVGGYSVRQVFDSPDDEAFYGLGGHQNGQMNYKGQDVDLVQHNIVDVVPFLYSSKNYGLLWDNYSISKFGDPREYESLNSLTLFDNNGKAGGLTATYFVKDKVVKSETASEINFEYLETPQVDSFPQDVARSGKVVWEGSFSSDKVGIHKFLVYASGYFKIWVDEKLLFDKWRQGWNPWSNKFSIPLNKDEKHTFKVEWIPDGGAYLAVKHIDPINKSEQDQLSLSSEVADEIDYYFIKGNNADDVISGYRQLTGKAPIPPKWAMGFWQSRERYKSQQEIIDVVKEYRKRKIPLDNIVLDWQYWEDPKWGSHEFDTKRFPDPHGMIDELHQDLHANLMISVWPKFNTGTANYEEMKKNGFLFTRNVEKKRKDWVGVGYESTFYDPFNVQAGKLFWKQIDQRLNKIGVDAWWLDATEPDMHSNLSIEERKLNMSPTALGSGARYFNAYSLVNARSVYEGQRSSSPEKRVFILTRSAYAGQQRYGAATWSGDIVSRWSDFQDQIATGINFSISGIPYWTMDIGGFAVEKRYEHATGETLDEWRELNARWFQFGAFCPLFRSHGQYPYREIYNIAPASHPVYNSMVFYDKLRYNLMPYIYSLAGSSYHNDYTIMRGLIMDFPGDLQVRTIADQYMFGPALLINPVYEYKARKRNVYLPANCGWYDLYTGAYTKGGGVVKVEAPLEQIPVFVKEGSIIPFGPDLQYTSEKTEDPITLFVFAGKDGSFSLYEDEGINYQYEKGDYSLIPFSYNDQSKTLKIGDRKGAYKNMMEARTFNIVWVKSDHPVGLSSNAHPDQVVSYNGRAIELKMQ